MSKDDVDDRDFEDFFFFGCVISSSTLINSSRDPRDDPPLKDSLRGVAFTL